MTENSIIKEWQPLAQADRSIKAPSGMIRAVKFRHMVGNPFVRDFTTREEAERNVALGTDDINVITHFYNEDGKVIGERNPLAATVAHDWRNLTSMWPKAPKGMFRVVLDDDESTFIERDFDTLDEVISATEPRLNVAWPEANIYDDTGKVVRQMQAHL